MELQTDTDSHRKAISLRNIPIAQEKSVILKWKGLKLQEL